MPAARRRGVQLYIGDRNVMYAPGPGRTATACRLPDPLEVAGYRHSTP
ncbi:hypothetical protein ACWY4P_22405 [Streptomyces sp. LZ34]